MKHTNQRKKRGNDIMSSNTNIKGSGKKKFRNTRLFKLLRILLLIIIIVFLVNIVSDLFKKEKTETTIVIGDKTPELKHEIITDDQNNIFLSKDDVVNLYDSNIYYNEADKTLITTYNKHIAVLELGKTTMSVNDSYVAIKGTLMEKNGILYLPFSEMGIVYDFEGEYNKEDKVYLVDSVSEAKSEAVVLKGCKLKKGTGLFSKKIETLKKSEYVTILAKEGKYVKVRSSSGNVGYIKAKKLSSEEVIREAMEEEKLTNVKILEEYNIVDSYGDVTVSENETSIVTPNLFNIDEECEVQNIIDLSGDKFQGYQTWASEKGINICANVTLGVSMNKLCETYLTRTYVINSLYTEIVKNKIPMVCIDFEKIDDTEGFYRFVVEMTPRFKEAGIKVLVKSNNGLNKDRLEEVVDYVI